MKKLNSLVSEEAIARGGRVSKHPSVIRYHSIPSNGDLISQPKPFISLDIESDHETGEMHLLGCYNGKKYWFYEENHLSGFVQVIDYCEFNHHSLSYWSKFDPVQLLRLLIIDLDPEEQLIALRYYTKIMASWNKKKATWEERPTVERKIRNKVFGISASIRASLQFFIRQEDSENIGNVWAYNIAPFYAENLKKTAKRYGFDWYSKMSEKEHLLNKDDWERFHHPKNKLDEAFRKDVLKSNELDAKLAWYLTMKLQNDFASVYYGRYPASLISSGSFTRASLMAYTEEVNKKDFGGKAYKAKVMDDLQSIGIKYHEQNWKDQLGEEIFKDFYSLCHEIYWGATIECYGYGYFERAFTADLSGAYPSTENELLDLRHSVIDYGVGLPPDEEKHTYVMIRGTVNIPDHTEYHPFLIRNPVHDTGNIHPTGRFRSCYWKTERDLGLEMGIYFENEEWYRITTKGQLSVIAGCSRSLQKIRFDLRAKNDPNEFRPKQENSGLYGINFEATPIYKTVGKDLVYDGLRGGKYLNSIYASRITSQTRCKMSRACIEIRKAGGKPIWVQTDAVSWLGKVSDLSKELWREEKTIGYFEKPSEIRDMISLGAGRYEYSKLNKETGEWDNYTAKSRGVYLEEIKGADGITIGNVRWKDELKRLTNDKIILHMKTLITPGMILGNKDYTVKDLGRIVVVKKELDPISGRNKRKIDKIKDLSSLATTHYWSEPIPVSDGLILGEDLIDNTLPILREELKTKKFKDVSKQEKSRHRTEDQKKEYREKYFILRKYGYDPEECKKKASAPWTDINSMIHHNYNIQA